MSGTSLDGIDAVLAQIAPSGKLQVLQHASSGFEPKLAHALLALNREMDGELHRAALASNALARAYAELVHRLLKQSKLSAPDIVAIGAHGQTIRHQPQLHDSTGYTLQLNNPALLAELCGIDVVADFRSRDLAAGGQGAPLVPAFHQGVFGQTDACVAVLNIGGMSNLSVLQPDGTVLGWDCGPGNALMDHWCRLHTGQAFDRDGAWARSGQVLPPLLTHLLQEPFFALPAPKSTGRDLFNPDWLSAQLVDFQSVATVDVQATLTRLTAEVCLQDLRRQAPQARTLLVCGGGALNRQLMAFLRDGLPGWHVEDTGDRGLPPMQVEAAAFAWLAFKCIRREPASLPSVTGARGARVLGAIYPR